MINSIIQERFHKNSVQYEWVRKEMFKYLCFDLHWNQAKEKNSETNGISLLSLSSRDLNNFDYGIWGDLRNKFTFPSKYWFDYDGCCRKME